MTGRVLGAATAQDCSTVIDFSYTATTVTQAIFIASYPCQVVDIRGRQRVNGGASAAINFFKSPSGTTAANGTALNVGAFDASSAGTADANQVLALSVVNNALVLAAGDSINIVVSGTMTSAVGYIQVTLEPMN